MKRSDAVEVLKEALEVQLLSNNVNEMDVGYVADKLLKVMEAMGMKPPSYPTYNGGAINEWHNEELQKDNR